MKMKLQPLSSTRDTCAGQTYSIIYALNMCHSKKVFFPDDAQIEIARKKLAQYDARFDCKNQAANTEMTSEKAMALNNQPAWCLEPTLQ